MKHKRQSLSKTGEDGEDGKDSPSSGKSKDDKSHLLQDENSKKSCQNCELTPTGLEVGHLRSKGSTYNSNSRSGASSVASSSSSFEKMATEDDSRSNDTTVLSPKGEIKLERKESPSTEKTTPPVSVIQGPQCPSTATPSSPLAGYPRPRSSPTVVTTVTTTVLHPGATRPFQQHSVNRPSTPRQPSQNFRHTYYLQQQYQQYRQTTPARVNGMHSPRTNPAPVTRTGFPNSQQQYPYGATQQQYNGYQQEAYYHRNYNYQEQEYANSGNYHYYQNQAGGTPSHEYYEQQAHQQTPVFGPDVKNETFFEHQDGYGEFCGGPAVLTPPTGAASEPNNDQLNHFHHFYSEPHHNPSPADTSNSSSDFNFLSNLANDFAPEYYQLS